MFKRIISFLLVLLLSFALVTVAFAADGESFAPPPSEIRFDAETTGWQDFSYVGFHIWEVGGAAFYDWGAKSQRGVDRGDGVWSYDLSAKGIDLDPDKQYAVIFYTDKGQQTYNLLFDTACLGDLAYADKARVLENPEDSQKSALPAYWLNQDPAVNGPEMKISSIGNVVGACIPRGTTREAMFGDFVKNTLANVRLYTEESDQQIIDRVGEGLGIGADAVEQVIATSGVEVHWSYYATTLAIEPIDPERQHITGSCQRYPYEVSVGHGEGEAVGDPESLLLYDNLTDAYNIVTLTATPAEGYAFGYWQIDGDYQIEGDGRLSNPVLRIRAYYKNGKGTSARAMFYNDVPVPGMPTIVPYTLSVSGSGTAKGDKEILTINYSVAPDYQYDTLTLTATPEKGWRFAGWKIEGSYTIEGDGKLTDAVLTIRAHDGIAAHAVFYGEDWDGTPSWVPYTVEVAEGEGTAKGDKDILIINYTVAPDYQYDTLTLTATPTGDSRFCCWTIEGDYTLEDGCRLTDAVITLRAHDGIAARAWFAENVPGSSDYVPYTVDVAQGEGTATGDKEVLTINYSVAPDYQYDTLTLTATPAEGYSFEGWTIEGDYALEDGCRLTDAVITLRAHDGIAAHARFYIDIPVVVDPAIVPTGIRGDADADGKITILDATRIQRYIAAIIGEDMLSAADADADGDGKITVLDATRIQRVLVNLCAMDGSLITKDEYELPIVNQHGSP